MKAARAISGFAFDPSSTSNNVILWVSSSDANLTDATDWTGKISKLTGTNLDDVSKTSSPACRAR